VKSRSRVISRRACAWMVLTAVVAAIFSLDAAGAFLVVADPVVKADAVVVLSGGGPERARTAAEFYHQGRAAWFVFTETGLTLPDSSQSTTDLNFETAASLGVPREAIVIAQKSSASTEDEARSVRAMAEGRNWGSIMVVTDPYHTRRTRLIFRREFSGTAIQINVRPAAQHWYHSLTWWSSVDGWRETFLEYGKLVHYLGHLG
jgi:uncharacterized SAM-binding protein YcdF (DUF218 family)